ncbi:DUF998 domain-containing protein [Geodermatophilus sp. URMC 64]
MGPVTANRLRNGALLWLLTLQFFVVETVAQLQWPGSYSRVDDVISDLGTAFSPAHMVMNASFVAQGALILGGALLLRPALRGRAAVVTQVLLGIAAVGVLLVGVFPSDGNGALHAVGAVAHLLGGGLGLIALAYAVRPRSEALGTTLAVLGLVGTALTIFFLDDVVEWLGRGGTERGAAYVIPIGLALAGAALWRLGADGDERQARREEERAARAEQARQRDEALEAIARPAAQDDDVEEPEDPWAPSVREKRDR